MKKENSLFKNTLALYIRMLFSVCVNIYISRVVLDVLGVEDFGIYSIVGGIVTLLSFINSSMSGATSRFLSIAIGKKNIYKITETYNAAKHLHGLIALLMFILAETIGLWIVNFYLSIPEDRIVVANWVYQFSVFTMLFSIIQVPYTAMVISMERMDVYAGIEILHVLMKLSIVLLLSLFFYDRLFMYGLLLLIEGGIVLLIYKIYCKSNYSEYAYSWRFDYKVVRPMLFFSGWDLLGWGGVSLSTQGRQIFINKFFGVALNAANSMAGTVGAAVTTFTNNIVMAFRPRIMKHYASNDYEKMQYLIEVALLMSSMLMIIIAVPMFYGMEFVLNVWLKEVPPFTKEFCRLLLIYNSFEVVNTVVKIGIHASGVLRKFATVGFLIHLFNILLTYFLYYIGCSVLYTYYVAILLCVLNVIANVFFLKILIPQIIISRISSKIVVGIIIMALAVIASFPIYSRWGSGSFITFTLSFISTIILILSFSFFLFKGEIIAYIERNPNMIFNTIFKSFYHFLK